MSWIAAGDIDVVAPALSRGPYSAAGVVWKEDNEQRANQYPLRRMLGWTAPDGIDVPE
jgi:hypothetical protein